MKRCAEAAIAAALIALWLVLMAFAGFAGAAMFLTLRALCSYLGSL